ncbi:hypothetical protein ARMSODRAFT_675109 [Armillaria solidipes]|uniref:Uncharacterized protein n=1 Tax=Armillaria solidipes TaxID=1076256 RepID=A0A2H3AQ88_9AGAR|nr:hypothetical protein ARMSODRAFT_675109 [Armillaria solidipes]
MTLGSNCPSSIGSCRHDATFIDMGNDSTENLREGTLASTIDAQFNVEDSVSTQRSRLLAFLTIVPRLKTPNTFAEVLSFVNVVPYSSVHKFLPRERLLDLTGPR